MKNKISLSEENKKRAAFKRFSHLGAAGLAVISLSAFTHLSAQQLPTFIVNDSIKELPQVITPTDSLDENNIFREGGHGYTYTDMYNYSDVYSNSYCDYVNYSNYSNQNNNYTNNYSNTYGNSYSNNYSNASGNSYSNNF
jgi:hypothetical protein